ncbi:MAG: hypothetical protein IJT34_11865 [Butyrivibrio sp.]|nr:hypothetical protein [Butyrivibrio sp.]
MAVLGLILILILVSAVNPGVSQAIGSIFPEDFKWSQLLPKFPKKENPENLEEAAQAVAAAGEQLSNEATVVATVPTDQAAQALDEASEAVSAAGQALDNAASVISGTAANLGQSTAVLPVIGAARNDVPAGEAEQTGLAQSSEGDAQTASDGLNLSDDQQNGPLSETELELLKRAGLQKDLQIDYLRPSEVYIETPSHVETGGYISLAGTYETVDPIRADELRESATVGNTGDGLVFDALYYPYYQMLDNVGKALYRQIYANARDLFAPFKPAVECSQYQLDNAFEAVYCDHPELFWVDAGYYGWVTYGGEVVQAEIIFYPTAADLTAAQNTFETEANRIIRRATGSNYEREKYVHDALAGSTFYDLEADMNQSAYSSVVRGKTVCAGYARAMQYILQQLSIPCYYCHGYAGEEHAWNIVCLDGEYYNVDVTWDDQGDEVVYDWFNRADTDFRKTHARRDLSVYLPACQGTTWRGLEDKSYYPAAQLPDGTHNITDYGLTEADLLGSLQAYNDDCRRRINEMGIGSYTFWNAVGDPHVLNEIDAEFSKKENLPFMSELTFDWERYSIHVEYYPLSNGGYAIQHFVTIRNNTTDTTTNTTNTTNSTETTNTTTEQSDQTP